MHIAYTIISAIAGTAVAVGNLPIPGFSKSFKIVVHIMDKSKEINPSVEGGIINHHRSRRYGKYGFARIQPGADWTEGNPYRLLGTQVEADLGKGNLTKQDTNGRNQPAYDIEACFNAPIDSVNTPSYRNVTLGGNLDLSWQLAGFNHPIAEVLNKDQFLACDFRKETYYSVYLSTIDAKKQGIPEGCVPIRLFSECTDESKVDDRYKTAFKDAPLARRYLPGGDYSLLDHLR